MKKIIVFIVFFTALTIYAQDSTYFHTLGKYGKIVQTIPGLDDNLYCLADSALIISLVKLDANGDEIKRRYVFETTALGNYLGMQLFRDSLLLVHDKNSVPFTFKAYEKDLEFIEDITISGIDSLTVLKSSVNQNNIVLYSINPENKVRIVFLDSDMEVLWIKNFDFDASISFYIPHIYLDESGNTLVSMGNKYLKRLSPDGEVIWEQEESFKYVSKPVNGSFYISKDHILKRISFSDGELWQKNLTRDITRPPLHDSENNVLTISHDNSSVNFILHDSFGNYIFNYMLDEFDLDCATLTDEKIYVGGTYYGKEFVARFLKNGNFRFLKMKPHTTITSPGHEVNIEWNSFQINDVNISYSHDEGDWVSLADIPAENQIYTWTLPNITGEIKFKIESTIDPYYSRISEEPVVSRVYMPYDNINANNVDLWHGANGSSAHDPRTDAGGMYWNTTGEDKYSTSFAEGPIFGYKKGDTTKVQGATYRFGLTPGKIYEDGTYTQPDDENYMIFQSAEDWENLPEGADKYKFQYSQNNWPVEDGAPFIDNNNNGTYEPEVDVPNRLGDRMMWWTSHTAHSPATLFLYGVDGEKIEVHTSVWASETPFPDVVYKKYLFTNKGGSTLTDFYFGYWVDSDLGNASDDFVGSDTLMQLAYTYNGDNNDDGYFGATPPAVGYQLLDGPIISGEIADTARFNGELRTGFKNLPMTSFTFYINGNPVYQDPDLGVTEGSVQMYNYLNGVVWNGDPFIDPVTNETTKFSLTGDPVNGSGWYEGTGWDGGPAPGDRRMMLSTGSFTLAPGDTQCVTLAVMHAKGEDRLESVAKLRSLARQVRNEWLYGIITDVEEENNSIPETFTLSQNYPNPFNPVTMIEFSLPEQSNVKLEVFNILGEKIADLVNAELQAGVHKVDFNGEGLASGLYIYRLTAGDVNLVRKMMLLK